MSIDLTLILKRIADNEMPARLPPVKSWHPEHVGEMDLIIDDQLQWFHEGAAFQRQSLIKLLASVLRKDGDDYYLVTPVEKMRITVKDVPFAIISMLENKQSAQPAYSLVTNTEEIIHLDDSATWQLREFQSGGETLKLPYVEVRDDLWARITRPVYYQMAALAEEAEDGSGDIFLTSGGITFALT